MLCWFKVEQPLNVLFTIVALATITATLLPLSRSAVWRIRTLDFPRIQIAIIGALVLAADMAFRTDAGPSAQFIRVVLVLCILYQAYEIRPYTILAGKRCNRRRNRTKKRL